MDFSQNTGVCVRHELTILLWLGKRKNVLDEKQNLSKNPKNKKVSFFNMV